MAHDLHTLHRARVDQRNALLSSMENVRIEMKKTSLFQGFLALMFVFVGPHMGCKDFFGSPYEAGLTPVAAIDETTAPAADTADLGATPIPQLFVEVFKDEGIPLSVCAGFIEDGYTVEVTVAGDDEFDVTVTTRAFCAGDNYLSVTPAEEGDIKVATMVLSLSDFAYAMQWDNPLEVNYSVMEDGIYSIENRVSENLTYLPLDIEP